MAEKLVLGIDGGGTKTVCLTADTEGTVLGRGTSGPSNYLTEGLYTAKASLRSAIESALKEAGARIDRVASVCAGLAGVSRSRDHEVMKKALEDLLPDATLLTLEIDAYIALVGATEGKPGIIVISGTGSIAFGVDRIGTRARSGGWGFVFGDEGSGYDIARRGLIAALREFDGRGPRTSIRDRITRKLDLSSTEDIIPLLYSNPLSPRKIASLYPLVIQAAEEGDEVAIELVREAAGALAESAAAVAVRLDLNTGFPLATSGGVFRSDAMLSAFGVALRSVLPRARLIKPLQPAEVGAVLTASSLLSGKSPFQDLQAEPE